jgi:hypothetical protein
MIDLVCETRKFRATRRLRVRAWQYLALALSLSATVWSTPTVSLAIRTVGFQVVDLADPGEEESESPDQEPVTDAEAFGMIPTRSRLVRDLRVGDRCRARFAADVSLYQGGRYGGERHAAFRRGGSAVQLPLRC